MRTPAQENRNDLRKKAVVSNKQKLRLDLKLCEHNKRFKLSHPDPR